MDIRNAGMASTANFARLDEKRRLLGLEVFADTVTWLLVSLPKVIVPTHVRPSTPHGHFLSGQSLNASAQTNDTVGFVSTLRE
jgi:hypothetical protein